MIELIINVDNPQLLEINRGKNKAIGFSVVFELGTGYHMVQKGYRVMGGMITAPHVPSGRSGRYTPVSFLSSAIAKMIYRAVVNSGWKELQDPGVEPLLDEDLATETLVPTKVDLHYVAPKWLRKLSTESVAC